VKLLHPLMRVADGRTSAREPLGPRLPRFDSGAGKCVLGLPSRRGRHLLAAERPPFKVGEQAGCLSDCLARSALPSLKLVHASRGAGARLL
jgi:hypothetical protein